MLNKKQRSHNSTFKPRPSPMRRASLSRSREGGKQAVAYRVVDEAQPWCQACGGHWILEHSHILTQKKYEHHRANPDNILRLCSECHALWENKKAAFKARYPAVWERHMDVMRRLEPSYYAHFCMKFPRLT